MKISEMTNEQATDALIRISEPLSNICEDDELLKILDETKEMRGKPVIKTFGKIVPKLLVFGLKNHREDIYEIISALLMVPKSKLAKMNFKETVDLVKGSYDDVLRDFFTSTADAVRSGDLASV